MFMKMKKVALATNWNKIKLENKPKQKYKKKNTMTKAYQNFKKYNKKWKLKIKYE